MSSHFLVVYFILYVRLTRCNDTLGFGWPAGLESVKPVTCGFSMPDSNAFIYGDSTTTYADCWKFYGVRQFKVNLLEKIPRLRLELQILHSMA